MFGPIRSFVSTKLALLRSPAEFLEGGAFALSVFLPLQAIVNRREFQMRLRPSGLRFDHFGEVANCIVQLALGAFQTGHLVTRHRGAGPKFDRALEIPAGALELSLRL